MGVNIPRKYKTRFYNSCKSDPNYFFLGAGAGAGFATGLAAGATGFATGFTTFLSIEFASFFVS
jgi:hypothetical protein